MEAVEYFRNRATMYRRWASELPTGSAERARLLAAAEGFDDEAATRDRTRRRAGQRPPGQ